VNCVWGRGVALTTTPFNAEVKEREKLYISTSPLGLRGMFYGEVYRYLFTVGSRQYVNYCYNRHVRAHMFISTSTTVSKNR
jgi:hypothetical protein